jgi:hypothetical protein
MGIGNFSHDYWSHYRDNTKEKMIMCSFCEKEIQKSFFHWSFLFFHIGCAIKLSHYIIHDCFKWQKRVTKRKTEKVRGLMP